MKMFFLKEKCHVTQHGNFKKQLELQEGRVQGNYANPVLSLEEINVVLTGHSVVRREGCGLGIYLSGQIAWIECMKP